MRMILGLLMIVGGIALGLYLGFWICFIGGIVQIANEFKSLEAVNALAVMWGVVRIFLAGIVGWISGIIVIMSGAALLQD